MTDLGARSESLSLLQARRIALGAQGFTARRPQRPGRDAVARTVARLGLLQIDSVNVLSRAHYVPLFSRLGPYPREVLDRSVNREPRLLIEYWAHEASLVPPETLPLLRFRMQAAQQEAWGGMVRIARDRPDYVSWVRDEVERLGPVGVGGIADDSARPTAGWGWNWTDAKRALEYLFWTGQISSAGRDTSFARRYDLAERVWPRHVYDAATPEPEQAYRSLVRVAARAHGVATEPCLRDYFRLPPAASQRAVAELVEDGELLPVRVQGWNRPAYLHREAQVPRKVRASALLSPFDSLIWTRPRAEALFGFRYRLEIYTPAHQRVHGYYVLPFLLGDQLVARVDLKADRKQGVLRVQAAWAEAHAPAETAERLATQLWLMAGWLGLSDVIVAGPGDLAPALAAAVPRVTDQAVTT
ncbi:MAG TPA: crosslink repair DNA glycosylase YcaQ family protein [Jiangellaceae bacterium]|nr:crosslink repair DNA glycosylase YcaQ family protein [Jiangellaceae bacterium]